MTGNLFKNAPSKEELQRLYSIRNNWRKVALELNIGISKCNYWLRKYGIKSKHICGERHPMWKGKNRNPDNYRVISINGTPHDEHILVMEKKLGRKIKKGEIVHHIDNNRQNNSSENLYLYSSHGEHSKVHNELRKMLYNLYVPKVEDLLCKKILIFEDGQYKLNPEFIDDE